MKEPKYKTSYYQVNTRAKKYYRLYFETHQVFNEKSEFLGYGKVSGSFLIVREMKIKIH